MAAGGQTEYDAAQDSPRINSLAPRGLLGVSIPTMTVRICFHRLSGAFRLAWMVALGTIIHKHTRFPYPSRTGNEFLLQTLQALK